MPKKKSPVANLVMHPVRLRIIQQLSGRELTTAQLREALADVSQATLYRHIAALVEAEILTVVAERQVRGTTERTLALGTRLAVADLDEVLAMDEAQLRTFFLTFLAHVSEDFERFLASGDKELRSYLGFGQQQLYVDLDDLPKLQAELAKLLKPYQSDRGGGKRRVSLATALIPEPKT